METGLETGSAILKRFKNRCSAHVNALNRFDMTMGKGGLTNKIRCCGKDRNYETISNKSEGKVKLPTSVGITCNNMGEDMIASGCLPVHLFYTQQHTMLHE